MTVAISEDVQADIRPMRDDDVRFVWETSLKVRKPHAVPWGYWVTRNGEESRAALTKPGATVVVLEAGGVLLGFAHFVGETLHMLYVKRDFRGHGFGASLIEGAPLPLQVAAPNACWRRWAYSKGLRWKVARPC